MADRTVFEIYDEPGMEWWLRVSGPHLHGGAEAATIALAQRAGPLGLGSGRVVEIASALGAPSRVLARTFGCEVVCIDMDARMHRAARCASAMVAASAPPWRCGPLTRSHHSMPGSS